MNIMIDQIKTKDGKYFGNVKRVVDPCHKHEHYVKEITEHVIDEYDSFGNNITLAKDIKYNSRNQVIHKYVEDDESYWLKTTSDYSYKDDKLIREIHKRSESWWDGYGYDNENSDYELTNHIYEGELLTKLISKDSSGQICRIIKYVYNENKKIIREYTIFYKSEWYGIQSFPYLCYIDNYKYNSNEQLSQIITYRADIEDNKIGEKKLSKKIMYYYDLEGRLKIKEEEYDTHSYIHRNTKFDKYGNAIEFDVIHTDKIQVNNSIWQKTYKRVFEYYE